MKLVQLEQSNFDKRGIMTRRIELTDELTQKIIEKILIGLPHESTAENVGVPY
jgi:Arc/MetJ family transcription regulator